MKMRLISTLFVLAAISFSCSSGGGSEKSDKKEYAKVTKEEWQMAKRMFDQQPATAPVKDDNPLNDAKVKLGQMLYHDTRLSNDGNISCNSCHNLATFGVDNLPTSPGDTQVNGERNSPTVYNAAFDFVQFWDGRAADVEEQALGPILNPVEHAMKDEKQVVSRLSEVAEYVKLFKEAFPNEKKPLTFNNVGKAIGAFERTLVFPSRFDRFMEKETSSFLLTAKEAQGLRDFQEAGCTTCHAGNQLGAQMYQKFGLYGDYWTMTGSKLLASGHYDEGRKDATGNESDKYFFKVPSLRNITKTAPYFHDGSVAKLEDAIKIMAKLQSNKDLNEEQVSNIAAFLKSLESKIPEDITKAPVLP
ncbi:c-type cytochrome [Flammeovirga sp. MY04]|uniref:cytochrome-c peroxidase n=1 Tax=Flammeovirga sp. MY04 TaxID=1191459 RepID=UPI00080628EC|nr:cytochrome c peroxidase [Flammeovirga sp. MY04]ANQ47427.1 c-type cytochrome [Flammeovirga sp. MY04]